MPDRFRDHEQALEDIELVVEFARGSVGPHGDDNVVERIRAILARHRIDAVPDEVAPEETTDVQRPPRRCRCLRPTMVNGVDGLCICGGKP